MKKKELIKQLLERIEALELEVFGGYEIEFTPDPYLLDPNKEVREDLMQQIDTSEHCEGSGPVAAEGGELGSTLRRSDEDGK